MNSARRGGAVFAAICVFATIPVHADQLDQQPANLVAGYVQVMNNYVGRGLSQSVGHPSVQAEIDLNPSTGPYATLSAVKIDWVNMAYPGSDVSVEIDATVGYRQMFAQDGLLEVGIVRDQFPGRYVPHSLPALRPDTTEIFGDVGWKGLRLKLNYAVTNAFGTPDSRGEWYLDLSGSRLIGADWKLGMHIGHKESHRTNRVNGLSNAKLQSYTDRKLSVARLFDGGLSLEVASTWNNSDPAFYTLNGYNVGGHHIAVTLEKDF
jgi:uncharacterized protein (TIGR02001 family)